MFSLLLDAAAVERWRVPDGMTARVHELEPREGGTFRVSLVYDEPGNAGKSAANTDTYRGRFAELVPDERVVEVLEFETADPDLQGEMRFTTTLEDDDRGTCIVMVHEGVPDAVPPEDNEVGIRTAIDRLAALAESG